MRKGTVAYNSQHAWRMAALGTTIPALLRWKKKEMRRRKKGRAKGKSVAYNSQHALCTPNQDYKSQHAPRAPAVTGHREPLPRSPIPPPVPQHSTAGHLHRCSLFDPQQGLGSPRTPEPGLGSSALTEIVAKWPKKRRGGSGSSVITARGAAGQPRARRFPGVPASQCLFTAITEISYRVFSVAQLDKYLPI